MARIADLVRCEKQVETEVVKAGPHGPTTVWRKDRCAGLTGHDGPHTPLIGGATWSPSSR